MTQRQRSISRIGGIVAIVAACLGIGAVAREPTAAALGVATVRVMESTIADTMRAHRRDQSIQIDSIKRQVDAIRCVIDGDYATRHPDACRYGVQP